MRRSVILGVSLLLTTLLSAGPAGAAGDPYAADPLGLVPFIDTAVRSVNNHGVLALTATDMEVARKILPDMDVLYMHQLRAMRIPRMRLVEADAHLKRDALILNPYDNFGINIYEVSDKSIKLELVPG